MTTIPRFHKELQEPTPSGITITEMEVPVAGANTYSSSTILVGKDYYDYSAVTMRPTIWALGNFAYHLPPTNPIQGQTWFDTEANCLKLLVGEDHSTSPDAWHPLKDIQLSAMRDTIVPDVDGVYKIGLTDSGVNNKKWGDVHVDDLISYNSFTIGGVSLQDLIPIDSANITNKSSVPGETVADAIDYLSAANLLADISAIENVYQNGGTYNLIPDTKRYRIHSDDNITINIDVLVDESVNMFQIISIGNGSITLTSGVGVTTIQNKAGTLATYIAFSRGSTLAVNTWRAFGNFI